MNVSHAQSLLPAQPFFSTPEQRLALARQRFFEEGIRPSGLVGEGVIQSWSRCLQARRSPAEAVAFNPVTESRIHSTLGRSRLLRQTAAGELAALATALAGTPCTVLLTDPHGVVVHVGRAGATSDEQVMPLAARVGVNLGEESAGTNAPGITARTGLASSVMGPEHFFDAVQVMYCAAAPIRDTRGQVAGVLDISSESRPFGFDAGAVVGTFATSIENRLLRAQSNEHIVVQLQTAPNLLGTPLEGLIAIAGDGSVAWANAVAARLLGVASFGCTLAAEEVLAIRLAELAASSRGAAAFLHRLPSGLAVWMQASMQAPDGCGHISGVGAGVGPAALGDVAEPRPVRRKVRERAA